MTGGNSAEYRPEIVVSSGGDPEFPGGVVIVTDI